MKTKHTPGPWTVGINDSQLIDGHEIKQIHGFSIAHVESWENSSEDFQKQSIANAMLIASTPELLECLHSFIETVDFVVGEMKDSAKWDAYKSIQSGEWYKRSKLVIQKATNSNS